MARPRKSQGLGIPYYAIRGARAFWEPRGTVPAGFEPRPLGPAGPAAEDRATGLYRRMTATKRGGDPSALRSAGKFPKGSVGAGYFRYRATSVWRDKEPRTREEWERVWARLGPIFGDVDPKTVSMEMLSE